MITDEVYSCQMESMDGWVSQQGTKLIALVCSTILAVFFSEEIVFSLTTNQHKKQQQCLPCSFLAKICYEKKHYFFAEKYRWNSNNSIKLMA